MGTRPGGSVETTRAPESQESEKKMRVLPSLWERVKQMNENPNSDSRDIASIHPDEPPEAQEDALVPLQGYVIEVIAKLKSRYDSLAVLKVQPERIFSMAIEAKLPLDTHQSNAMYHLRRLMQSEGRTSRYLKEKELWQYLVNEGVSISERGRVKFEEAYRAHPVLTTGATLMTVFGLGYAGIKGLSAIFGSKKEKVQATPKSESKSKISSKWKWLGGIGLSLAALGAVVAYNREDVVDWLKESVKDQYLPSIDKVDSSGEVLRGVTDKARGVRDSFGAGGEVMGSVVEEATKRARGAREMGHLSEEGETVLNELGEHGELLRELIDSNERLSDPSDIAIISASIGKGMRNRMLRRHGKSAPTFLGEGSVGSDAILEHLKNNKEQLRGKKMALIHAGGNNLHDGPEVIVPHIREMVDVCKSMGVPKIAVMTRYPYLSDLDSNSTLPEKMERLVVALREEFGDDPTVQFVDLYGHYSNVVDPKTKRLPPEYNNEPNQKGEVDRLHPFKAYDEGWKVIAQQTHTPEIEEWISGSKS